MPTWSCCLCGVCVWGGCCWGRCFGVQTCSLCPIFSMSYTSQTPAHAAKNEKRTTEKSDAKLQIFHSALSAVDVSGVSCLYLHTLSLLITSYFPPAVPPDAVDTTDPPVFPERAFRLPPLLCRAINTLFTVPRNVPSS